MSKLALAKLVAGPEEWDRRRLQVLLGIAVFVVIAVAVGIVWSVQALIAGNDPTTGDATESGPSEQQIANSGQSSANLSDAQPGPLSTGSAGTIALPQPGKLGESQVATGFPRTSAGALAQLIAIDQRAIGSASVVTAQDVIATWAMPGGPTAQTWSGVEAVTVLLSSAGLPANGSTDLQVVLDPAMGSIKTDPADQTVMGCVDFVVTITVTGTAGRSPANRIAVADCQRMVWNEGRWMIGPGTEPAPSPSLWPGTQASYDAGYQWLEVSP
jgi:hypothetical protein